LRELLSVRRHRRRRRRRAVIFHAAGGALGLEPPWKIGFGLTFFIVLIQSAAASWVARTHQFPVSLFFKDVGAFNITS
jgi:hypothetical protein